MSTASRPPSSPALRARGELSRERIGIEALALIDEGGLSALSLRGLAQRLGCEAMSLYHHVQGKEGVLDAVVDQLIAEVALPEPDGHEPRKVVRKVSDSYRALASRHPQAFVLLAARRFSGGAALNFLEYLLARFADAGLAPAARAVAFRMLGYFLNGVGLAEGAVTGTGPLKTPTAGADGASDAFPQVRAVAQHLGPSGLDAVYEQGIEALLDQIFRP